MASRHAYLDNQGEAPMKPHNAPFCLSLAVFALAAALDAGAKTSAPTATMEDHYRTNGWGAFPFASIATLRPMGGRPAPVPYPQLSMKAPLENMICRTDHQDKGQTTWQVGTQWGDKCIYFFAGRQDMNGAARSHVLMVDPNIASRFKFEPVRTEVIKKGKGGTGRATVIANKGLVQYGKGYDITDIEPIGRGAWYDYHVCRVKHRDNLWHYGKLRGIEPQCMYAGNATGLGITSGYEVLVLTP